MPGRPRLHQLSERIEHDGGEDAFFELMASGESLKKLCARYKCSRGLLYDWRRMGGEERRRRWEEAQRDAAESFADEGLEILDGLDEEAEVSPARVSLAEKRVGHRRWLAEVRDPERFGGKKNELNVNLSFGDLHLNALKKLGSMNRPSLPSGEIVEAEVVEE